LGSYTTLDLGELVTFARGGSRLAWLTGGCVAMGIGAWAMHYSGMLAFRLPIPVQYDRLTSFLSLLPSISWLGIAGSGGVTVMVLEITLLTSLVDRLQKQRVLLDELFEQAPQAIVLMNLDRQIVPVSVPGRPTSRVTRRQLKWMSGWCKRVAILSWKFAITAAESLKSNFR
jgi:hypothetical protein